MMARAMLEEAVANQPDVVFRVATEADVPQMIALAWIALGAGSVPRTEAFWRWKHEQNPFGPSPAMVADADGRIVSLRIFLRWRWLYGEKSFAAVRPVDTATHPEWRRRGLFERLTRELLAAMRAEGIAFVFNTPNADSGRGYRKLGWRIVGRPSIWVRPVRPVRLVRHLTQWGVGDGLEPALSPTAVPSTELLGSPDLAPFLKRATRRRSRLVTDADAAYLAWRYRDSPGLDYGAAGAFDRRSGALVVFRRALRQGLKELRLCDLFIADDTPSRSQVRQVIDDLLRGGDFDLCTARALPGTRQATVLARSGFVPLPGIGPTLAVRPLLEDADLPALDRLSTWGASIGDLEVF